MIQSLTQGVHHVGLAVKNLEQTRAFFCDELGFKIVGGVPDYPSTFVSDGFTMITLWQVADPGAAIDFDRRNNVGLHHLALAVPDEDVLNEVFNRMQAHPDTTVEFSPTQILEGSAARHFICIIPGGIRVEFATPMG